MSFGKFYVCYKSVISFYRTIGIMRNQIHIFSLFCSNYPCTFEQDVLESDRIKVNRALKKEIDEHEH